MFVDSNDRNDVQVKAFGVAAVQSDLFLAKMPSSFERTVVQETRVNRILDLVGGMKGGGMRGRCHRRGSG